ncbi:MAG: ABC transporter permease [Oscillospiraceae bacterium]|nr:ABC transporter permease [Oscillospiraceae bacterium]MBR5979398.1 ABC transporter permease [Oscillospiraceae bacterium]
MEEKKTFKDILMQIWHSREASLIIVLIILSIIMSIATPAFTTKENLISFIKQCAIGCVASMGQTFIVASANIDLSIGEIMNMSGILMAMFIKAFTVGPDKVLIGNTWWGTLISWILAMIIGACLGLLNGVLLTKLRLPAFIITLGTQYIIRGIDQVITKGYPVTIDNDAIIHKIGVGGVDALLGTPYLFFFVPVAALVGWFILDRTVLGNHIKALGGNETAARLSGLDTSKLRVITYVICGIFAGYSAIMMVARLNSGSVAGAGNVSMDAVAATVVGGTSMSGGNGSVIGTLLGCVLMQFIKTSMVLLQVNMYWQTAVIGVVLIAVCGLDSLTQKITR